MYAKRRSTLKKLIAVLSMILVMLIGVAGTLSYLQVATQPVQNTFAPSNIGLKLEETERTYDMVPGVDMLKDPTVTVSGDVDAYVFVKVAETNPTGTYTFDEFLSYAIAEGWTLLTDVEGLDDSLTTDVKIDTVANGTYVIYREVKVADEAKTFSVLDGNKVTTNTGVTKQMMDALCNDDGTVKEGVTVPTLTFTAYAIQMANGGAYNNGNFTPAEAWSAAQGQQT